MKKETFYIILDERLNLAFGVIPDKLKAIEEAKKIARNLPGKEIHIMKRITTVIANEFTFIDSD
jgi:hypothetical protein